MKKYLFLFAACAFLAACDPDYTFEVYVANGAPKDLEIHTYHVDRLDSIVDSQLYTVPAGKTPVLEIWSEYGSPTLDKSRNQMRRQFWRDSVRFEFSDGCQMAFRVDSVVTDGPYDFTSKRYDYLEKSKRGSAYYSSLTYSVTPADYAAAVQP